MYDWYEAHGRAAAGPVLTVERERELVESLRTGSKKALDELVNSHMRLAVAVAKRYARAGLPLEDLVSEGSLGLVEAARRFDPDKGTRFGTYAAWWVRAFVRRYAYANRRIVPTPSTRNARKVLGSLGRVEREVSQRTGEAASQEELAQALGVQPEEVAMVTSALGARDLSIGPTEDGRTVEVPDEAPTPEDHAANEELRYVHTEKLDEAMNSLSEREREIVRQRFLTKRPATLSKLGAALGVSRERIRQLQVRAEGKLRAQLAARVA